MGVLPMFCKTKTKKSTAHTGVQQQQQLPTVPAKAAVAQPRPVVPTRVSVHEKKLGSGAYGSVQLGTVHDGISGATHSVAVKLIAEERMRPESLSREASILERLNGVDHPSTVNFYGWFKPGSRTVRADDPELSASLKTSHCFVMETMHGGELFEYVLRRKGLSEVEAAPFLRQIAEGLLCAHTRGIAHRDLKLENVLFAGEAGPSGLLKLIDWGLAHQHEVRPDGSIVGEHVHSRCGSRSYMAPEVVAAKERSGRRGPGYDAFAADVWSLGVCMFAMLIGFFPFDQADPAADWRARQCVEAQREGGSVVDTIFGFYPKKRLHISREAKQLLDSMFTFDASQRATLEQVLASRWLAPSAPQQHLSLASLKLDTPAGCEARNASASGSSVASSSPAASESTSRSSDGQQPTGRESLRESSTVRLKVHAARGSSASVSSAGSSVRASVARLDELSSQPADAVQQRALRARWSIVA